MSRHSGLVRCPGYTTRCIRDREYNSGRDFERAHSHLPDFETAHSHIGEFREGFPPSYGDFPPSYGNFQGVFPPLAYDDFRGGFPLAFRWRMFIFEEAFRRLMVSSEEPFRRGMVVIFEEAFLRLLMVIFQEAFRRGMVIFQEAFRLLMLLFQEAFRLRMVSSEEAFRRGMVMSEALGGLTIVASVKCLIVILMSRVQVISIPLARMMIVISISLALMMIQSPYRPKQKQPRAPSVQPSAPPLEKGMMHENLLPGRREIIHGDHLTLLSDMFCDKTGRIACIDCILSEMDQLLVSEMTLHEMDSSERFQYLGAKKFTDFPGNRDDLYPAAETERAANFLLTELLQDLENLMSMQLSSSHQKNSAARPSYAEVFPQIEDSDRDICFSKDLICRIQFHFFKIVLDMMEPRGQKLHRAEVRFDNCLKQLKEMGTSASRCSNRVEHSQLAADGVGQPSWGETITYFEKLLNALRHICCSNLSPCLRDAILFVVSCNKSRPGIVARSQLRYLLMLTDGSLYGCHAISDLIRKQFQEPPYEVKPEMVIMLLRTLSDKMLRCYIKFSSVLFEMFSFLSSWQVELSADDEQFLSLLGPLQSTSSVLQGSGYSAFKRSTVKPLKEKFDGASNCIRKAERAAEKNLQLHTSRIKYARFEELKCTREVSEANRLALKSIKEKYMEVLPPFQISLDCQPYMPVLIIDSAD
ncbi:hypothetical protein OROHE_019480 [Orobanche hederae]